MSKESKQLFQRLRKGNIPCRILPPPHDSMVVTDCEIRIKRVSDGKEVTYKDYLVWSDDYDELELCTYIWSEGNYSCSCNRGTFFDRAMKVPEIYIPDYKCGEDDYQVEIKDWTGMVIYSDFAHTTTKE